MTDRNSRLNQDLTATFREPRQNTGRSRNVIGAAFGIAGVCAGLAGLAIVLGASDRAVAEVPAALTPSVTDTELATYRTEIADLSAELTGAQADAAKYEGSLVGSLAAARAAQIQLSQAMLRNLVLTRTSGTPLDIKAPALTPDPQKADSLLAEIAGLDAKLKHDETEAARYSGGLVLAMIMSRIETQKLQRAQLHGGWIEATYGVPMTPTGIAKTQTTAQTAPAAPAQQAPKIAAVAPWADPNHPEIDYHSAAFSALDTSEYTFHGWWAVTESRAAVDDSEQITAINLSQYGSGYKDQQMLIMRCTEGEAGLIYMPDEFLSLDYRSKQGEVIYRLDAGQAVTTHWSSLTTNKGVGLFGRAAVSMMQTFAAAQTAFIRVSERDGARHDATFTMTGAQIVIDKVKAACT